VHYLEADPPQLADGLKGGGLSILGKQPESIETAEGSETVCRDFCGTNSAFSSAKRIQRSSRRRAVTLPKQDRLYPFW